MESWLRLFGGFACVALGIWIFSAMLKETKKGLRDRYGNDIGIYFSSILLIILGLILIYEEGFQNV